MVLGGVGRRLSVRYSKKTLEGANPRARGAHIQLVRTLPRRWLESYTVTADSFYPALFACFLGLLAVHSNILGCIRADLTAVFIGTTV